MANINVYDLDGKVKQSIRSPSFFSMESRKDLISRVVSSIEAGEKQPQGRDPLAGTRNTARSWDQVMLQREFLDVRDLDILELEMLHLYLEP
jgi:ribosomal protein L4